MSVPDSRGPGSPLNSGMYPSEPQVGSVVIGAPLSNSSSNDNNTDSSGELNDVVSR